MLKTISVRAKEETKKLFEKLMEETEGNSQAEKFENLLKHIKGASLVVFSGSPTTQEQGSTKDPSPPPDNPENPCPKNYGTLIGQKQIFCDNISFYYKPMKLRKGQF